jgi:putative heme-binding domain-containing protein
MAHTARLCRLISTAALAVVSLSAQFERGPIPERPEVNEQEIADGKRLFDGHCGGCHGPGGRGALGPNLARPKLSRATDAESLFLIIDLGIEGTEMPRGGQLHDLEIWKITAYVESLGKLDPEPLPGDPIAGKHVYESKGNCATCHWLNGSGGRQGPELSEIGAARSVAHLRQALLEPSAAVPRRFLLVTATHKDGRRIQGVRLYDGPFSIQIRDFSDKLHSLMKSELTEVVRREGESSMPSYASTLSNTEVNDLVAYLATLQGGS